MKGPSSERSTTDHQGQMKKENRGERGGERLRGKRENTEPERGERDGEGHGRGEWGQ